MRYLNKIIFLNSAHIPYSEVMLDGNVHFIGTQGVGKSTLLRAILFFYNADKLKLGIPKEKKGFDAFYFPFSNSYIVYEVMRENGAYSIIAAKSQGRVFFRFVDAPYTRHWFLNEDNEVISEWGRIHERIGKGLVSGQVTSYEMYRDIIFGNNGRREMVSFRKFAIVESSKYQNVPRTIQNVFLNSKLDADFVKDTIIRSMNDEETYIDMDYYRNQIKAFEQEYNDVMLWYTKNKNGEILVRKTADKVISTYRDLLYTQTQIKDARAELNFAERRARENKPLLDEEIKKANENVARTRRLIDELSDKYRKENITLNSRISILVEKLKDVREKLLYYEQGDIQEVTRRVEQEDNLQQELTQVNELKNNIEKAYDNILFKYQQMTATIEKDYNIFENAQQSIILKHKEESSDKIEQNMVVLQQEEARVRRMFNEKLETVEESINLLREELSNEKNNLMKIKYEHPYQDNINGINEDIQLLKEKEHSLDTKIGQLKLEADRMRMACEKAVSEQKRTDEYEIDLMREQKAEVEKQLTVINKMIENCKGSFFEWLGEHKPNWTEDIGKIADEETILYNQNLQPTLAESSHSLYGISLDLSGIEKKIRTPEEMKNESEALQMSIEEWKKKISLKVNELNEKIENIEKKYNRQLRETAERQHLQEAERMQIPSKLKCLEADKLTWITKEKEWKEENTRIWQTKINESTSKKLEADNHKQKIQLDQDKQLKICLKEYNDRKDEIEKGCNEYIKKIQDSIVQKRIEAKRKKVEILSAQDKELSGKGIDQTMIRQYEKKISEIKAELEYIKQHRSMVFEYAKDKRELFDKEPHFKAVKKEVEAKLADLESRYAMRKNKYQVQLNEQNEQLKNLEEELRLLTDGLKRVDDFRNDEHLCPPETIILEEKNTRKSCASVVDDLKSLILSTMDKTDTFKKYVTQFNGNFSAKNTFHFRIELVSIQDFYDFASNLCEFVDNDKITDYQQHISERYVDILSRISKEVGDLTRNESEIRKTIMDINNDFVERNFAGVIKEISLRPLGSSDRMMQLLLEIKRFNDENQYNMGKVNLFSQDTREAVNSKAVSYLLSFMKQLLDDPSRHRMDLSDTFKLEFRVVENDNDTGWVEKIANVGSDGTDILVKAMVNIMLINVFKEKASRKFGEFKIHCMMDEIGKLHPNNVKGILDFANSRNILLINSSPTTYNVEEYRYTYLLSKDNKANTKIVRLLSIKNKNNI